MGFLLVFFSHLYLSNHTFSQCIYLNNLRFVSYFSNGISGQSPSPPLVSVEPRYVEAQLGQSIDVRCTAQGFPTPSIQWLSAREILVSCENNHIIIGVIHSLFQLFAQVPTSDGVLKIASVRKSDEGEYTCTASNPSGTSTGRVNIFVRSGRPLHSFI